MPNAKLEAILKKHAYCANEFAEGVGKMTDMAVITGMKVIFAPIAPLLGQEAPALLALWNAQMEWTRLTTPPQDTAKPAEEGPFGDI
jgi:hypothetical protein